MGLSVTVLGCDGSYPGVGGACSGYLVRGAGTTIWLDAGSGTLANLQRHVGLDQLDAVVVSHEHPDHWSDVEGYRVACTYGRVAAAAPLYAPAGVLARLYGGVKPDEAWHTVTDGGQLRIGGLGLRFSRTDHPPETLAVRVDGDGRSLAYSADTGPGWSFQALGDGIDLALCEATWPADQEGSVHLSARQAGAMARAAGVRSLLLTHLRPGADRARSLAEAAAAYGEPVDVARLHEVYPV